VFFWYSFISNERNQLPLLQQIGGYYDEKIDRLCVCCKSLLTVNAAAAGIDQNVNRQVQEQSCIGDVCIAPGVETRVLDKAESIMALMSAKELSYADAADEYEALTARSERIEERMITYDAGAGCKIEVGCTVKVACGSGHCNFVEVLDSWSKAAASGTYTWDGYYATVTIEGTTKDTLRFQSRGAVEVAVSTSSSAGFEAAGFSVTNTVGNTVYLRKVVSINQTKKMGS